MSDIVIDASALLAMLNAEPGGAKVAARIASARISAINYAEVASHFVKAGMPEREVDAMLAPLPMTIVDVDPGLARLAGRLSAVPADPLLSIGDRFCLALAIRDGAPAWTADRKWRAITSEAKVEVVVIR
ncbi:MULTISPECIES: type II toxin-antitoxin system VapC family toxin [Sphingobium]|jgi:ribonuclease VapC|uniref:Ribonuclease VapC n=1 Tax=Sphingobium algorifonticola TaxID=2008318 RepID=A0A437J4I9_9SPHN|nr:MULTISPECIES: type II toxin-antitoxin system VapC family toxin [Sphingobium]MDG2515880.1 type II toxin-antitoxin system VapC family toxin [Sphingobium yanoikuyae]RVT39582.1 PIN domain-containing protein [Sphingobium algorifonticola]